MNTQLTKASTSDELRQYFNAILQLAKSENKFPINLDEVWALVYSQKHHAIRELKKSFIEGEDYITTPVIDFNVIQSAENNLLTQNGEQDSKKKWGGNNKVTYFISLSCLEYFIARKVRPVFEVYRQVFHKTAQQQMVPQVPTSFREALLLAAKQQEEIERLEAESEQKDRTIETQRKEIKTSAPKVNYYDETLLSRNTLTTTQVAKSIGLNAVELSKKLKQAGIIYRQSDMWMLKDPYCKWNLHATRTATHTRSDGSIGTNVYTVWTERGRRFIVALAQNDFKPKLAIQSIRGETAKKPQEEPPTYKD